MPWGALITEVDIEESVAGQGAFSAFHTLNPGEAAHIFVTRTDTTPGQLWRVSVFISPDSSLETSISFWAVDNTAATLKISFPVTGIYGYKIQIRNGTLGGGSDLVKADIATRLNQVSF